jgi:hypothetical protein
MPQADASKQRLAKYEEIAYVSKRAPTALSNPIGWLRHDQVAKGDFAMWACDLLCFGRAESGSGWAGYVDVCATCMPNVCNMCAGIVQGIR